MPLNPNHSLNAFTAHLKTVYEAANFAAAASAMDVNTLRRVMDQIITGYSQAKATYDTLVAEVGKSETRSLIAGRLRPTPVDIDTDLAAVRTEVISLVSTYDGLVHNQGARAFTFDLSSQKHTEVQIPAAALSTLDFAGLETALASLKT